MNRDAARRTFDTFLARMRPEVFAWMYRACGDVALADDLAQNALVEAFLAFSEGKRHSLDRLGLFRFSFRELSKTIGHIRPWEMDEGKLVDPLLTTEEFWRGLGEKQGERETVVSQRESLQIGFLSLLQSMPFWQRMVYLCAEILGLETEACAQVMDLMDGEVREHLEEAQCFMGENYFEVKEGDGFSWRGEKERDGQTEAFVKILHERGRGAFLKTIDSGFHSLLVPAPILGSEVFFEAFLRNMTSCRMLDFELNGQQAFAFADRDAVQAIAVLLCSAKGPVTVLGYDLETLTPKIRNRTLEAALT